MAAPSRLSVLSILVSSLVLAGCSGDRAANPFSSSDTPSVARPAAPPVNMAGRWLLASPGLGQCNMTFGGTPGSAEGTIAPEGGCPGQFYTSRKWTFDSTGLTIRNHNGEPLAQLSAAGNQFTGQSTAGAAVTLTR